MKTSHTLFLCLALGTPGLLALDWAGDRVAFTPKEGSRCIKTFSLTQGFDEGELTVSNGGIELVIGLSGQASQSITVEDTYHKLEGAKPTRLSRTFKDGTTAIATRTSFAMKDAHEEYQAIGDGESRLNDLAVDFVWDEELGEYRKTFDGESEGESAWLSGLRADMDLRGFLPAGEVSVDEEWSAGPGVLLATFVPGGNLQWDLELVDQGRPSGVDPAMFSELAPMLADAEIDGEILCRYAGPTELEGVEYLAIEVTLEVDAFTDLSEQAAEELDEEDLPEGMGYELGEMVMELHLEGTGTLLWDAQAGHLHSFSYSGETAIRLDRMVSITGHGKVIENSIHMEVDGTLTLEVTTE